MKSNEYALDNAIDYNNPETVLYALLMYTDLRKVADKGNMTAMSVYLDLTAAMTCLTDRQLYCVTAVVCGGAQFAEIGRELGIDKSAVYRHTQAAVKKIATYLAKTEQEPAA